MVLHYGDMLDGSSLARLVSEVQPDEVYNLAAQSHVKVSFELSEMTANVDGLGALRILDAIRTAGLGQRCRFYQASTSELFGKIQEPQQRETTPFYPRSPYGMMHACPSVRTILMLSEARSREVVCVLDGRQLPGGLRHVCRERHPLQSRVSSSWGYFCHEENHAISRQNRAQDDGVLRVGELGRRARLGSCERLRQSHAPHAAAGGAGGLCRRDGRKALCARVRGAGLPVRGSDDRLVRQQRTRSGDGGGDRDGPSASQQKVLPAIRGGELRLSPPFLPLARHPLLVWRVFRHSSHTRSRIGGQIARGSGAHSVPESRGARLRMRMREKRGNGFMR